MHLSKDTFPKAIQSQILGEGVEGVCLRLEESVALKAQKERLHLAVPHSLLKPDNLAAISRKLLHDAFTLATGGRLGVLVLERPAFIELVSIQQATICGRTALSYMPVVSGKSIGPRAARDVRTVLLDHGIFLDTNDANILWKRAGDRTVYQIIDAYMHVSPQFLRLLQSKDWEVSQPVLRRLAELHKMGYAIDSDNVGLSWIKQTTWSTMGLSTKHYNYFLDSLVALAPKCAMRTHYAETVADLDMFEMKMKEAQEQASEQALQLREKNLHKHQNRIRASCRLTEMRKIYSSMKEWFRMHAGLI